MGILSDHPSQRRNPTQALCSTPLPAAQHICLSAACQPLRRTRQLQPWLHGHPCMPWCPAHASQSSRAKNCREAT